MKHFQTLENRACNPQKTVPSLNSSLRNNGRKLPFFGEKEKNHPEIYQIDSRFLENFYPAISGVR